MDGRVRHSHEQRQMLATQIDHLRHERIHGDTASQVGKDQHKTTFVRAGSKLAESIAIV